MLSYRHAFHAGNAADVLKHLTLLASLGYLNQKETPWLYIDTHAGAGAYDLHSGYAAENEEWAQGLARLRKAFQSPALAEGEGVQTGTISPGGALSRTGESRPAAIARYLAAINAFEAENGKGRYPGSPLLAAGLMRGEDRAVLYELHPSDAPILETELRTRLGDRGSRGCRTECADGLSGFLKLLPPPTRRALTLIDPSYELKEDYERVPEALGKALRRFATGVYIVWYPLLQRAEALDFGGRILERCGGAKTALVELQLKAPSPTGYGMYGSGLAIVNPPWILKEELEESLPALTRILGEDEAAQWRLQWHA